MVFNVVFAEFIPTLSTQIGKKNFIVLSNYINNYKECKLKDSSKNLQNEIKNDSLFVTQINSISGLEYIDVECEEKLYNIIINKKFTREVIFKYYDVDSTFNINVMGNFNDWNRNSNSLVLNDNYYHFHQNFIPGNYEYKFVVNGKEILDENNLDSIPNGLGGWNSILKIEDQFDKLSGQIIKNNYELIDNSVNLNFKFKPNIKNERLNPHKTFILLNDKLLDDSQINIKSSNISISISDTTNGRLRIIAENNFGKVLTENHTILKNGIPLNPENDSRNIHFTVLYSLMVDRFHNGNIKNDNAILDELLHPLGNFHGGDIAGITRKLKEGYFTDLGINMIWMSPLLKGPEIARVESVYPYRKYSGYHGYWPASNTEIEPRFGTSEGLQEMIQLAHDKDIKVIMDFVSNHVYEENPYYIEHPEWFSEYELANGEINLRKWDGDTRLTTWFESFLPTYDFTNNPDALNAVVNNALTLLKTYNLDGFRQDATKHVAHEFWKLLTNKIRTEFPNESKFQIGETFGSNDLILSYVNPAELNSQFNFDLYFSARNHFAKSLSFIDFNKRVRNNLNIYQPVNQMGSITSSHDQVRFMAFADNQIEFHENGTERAFHDLPNKVNGKSSYDKLFAFTVMNMVLPGIPVVYYGEEYGQIGANDPGNRLDMKFRHKWNKNERELNEKIKLIIQHRKLNPAFALGDLEIIYEAEKVTVWKKTYFSEEIIVIFNNSTNIEIIKLNTIPGQSAKSILNDSVVTFENSKTNFVLEPFETRIYQLVK